MASLGGLIDWSATDVSPDLEADRMQNLWAEEGKLCMALFASVNMFKTALKIWTRPPGPEMIADIELDIPELDQ
jgi:hypothetical protein